MRSVIACLAAAAVSVSASGSASPIAVPVPTTLWSLPLGGTGAVVAGGASPVLAVPNGVVMVYAYDASADGVGSTSSATVVFVDTLSREIAWSFELPTVQQYFINLIPTSDGLGVFVVGSQGIWRLSIASGAVTWAHTDFFNEDGTAFTLPTPLAGLLVAQYGSLTLFAEDTGVTRWARTFEPEVGAWAADPTLARIVVTTSANVTAYDTNTGSPLWVVAHDEALGLQKALHVSAERVTLFFFNSTTNSGTISVLDLDTGVQLFSVPTPTSQFSNINQFDVFDVGTTGIACSLTPESASYEVYVLEAATGATRWTWSGSPGLLPTAFSASADGSSVIVGTSCEGTGCPDAAGVLYYLAAETGAVTWTSQVPPPGFARIVPISYFSHPPPPFVPPAGGILALGIVSFAPPPGANEVAFFMSFDGTGALTSQLEMEYNRTSQLQTANPLLTNADGSVLYYLAMDASTLATSFVAAALPGHAASDSAIPAGPRFVSAPPQLAWKQQRAGSWPTHKRKQTL